MMRSAVALWLAAAGAAHAATLEGVLALQSDKVVRGASQSGGEAVLVADGSWRGDGGLSLVGGLSTLGSDRRRGDAELTLGTGYGAALNDDLAWRAGATRYDVLGSGSNKRPAYVEAAFSLGWQGRLQALVALAPSYPGQLPGGTTGRGQTRYVEATWHQALPRGFAADAGVGHVEYRGLAFVDYRYGSLGLSWRQERLQIVLSLTASDSPAPVPAGRRTVLSLLWNL